MVPNPQIPVDNSATAAEVVPAMEDRHGLYDGPNSSYKLAFSDTDFLLRQETRGIRFQLEMMKPDLVLREEQIKHTIVVFGSARFPSPEEARAQAENAKTPDEIIASELAKRQASHYQTVYDFAHMVGKRNLSVPVSDRMTICTGGGPGLMCAANRGAFEAGDKTIGMNIVLPFEQQPNPYITPRLCFQFFYFALRKIHLVKSARAVMLSPGGLGTMDEGFEVATLVQTGKIDRMPIIFLGRDYWRSLINFPLLVSEGTISPDDIDLFTFVDTPEEAWQAIKDFYKLES